MLKFTAACNLASVQCHDGKALSTRYSPAQICNGKLAAPRFEMYTLHSRRDESKATPPLHHSTSYQNPTTSISIDIAPQHPHLHKRSLHNSSATLRWISFSAQQLAPRHHHTTPTPDTHTGFRPPIPPRHLHIIIPYCHIFPSWFSHCSGITNYTSGAFLPRQRSGVARR